jgi:hypothetical protein
MKTNAIPTLKPVHRTLPVTEFCRTFNLSRSAVWRAMDSGDLRWIALRKNGKRLVIIPDELLCESPSAA